MSQFRQIGNGGWDLRVFKMIVSKIKPFKMNKMEKAAGGVNRTVETATIEVQANHMAREITLYPIP